MKRHMLRCILAPAAVALALIACTADAALKSKPSDLVNVAAAGDQDSGATGAVAYTDLTFAYTFVFYNARGVRRSIDVYSANLTVTCAGLTAGASYDVGVQYPVYNGGYQIAERSRLVADESGNASATFEIFVGYNPISVSRVIGTPQVNPWNDTVTAVLQGWPDVTGH